MAFKLSRAEKIPEILIIEPVVYRDERGFFAETHKHSEFMALGFPAKFVQDNHSRSIRGVLRGLHFQKPPKALGKLVQVIEGEIFDVAVDVRKGSPTYGQWVGEILSGENKKQMYTPEGFAHGFVTLSDSVDVLYKMTGEYAPEHEIGLIWNDPDLAIAWPIDQPILSKKDAANARLNEIDSGFVFEPSLVQEIIRK